MVSGVWGLKAFRIGRRGYLYYQPDEEEPYIVAAWEPAEDVHAFRACFLNTYTSRWHECGLPPFMGQWATGPFDIMLDAVCIVLQKHQEYGSVVLKYLQNYCRRAGSFDDLVEKTSESVGMKSGLVTPMLRSYADVGDVATVVHTKSLAERELRVLVAAFLHVIADYPLWRAFARPTVRAD